ncbi:hypothetical protein PROFUN_09532 [Planoprotostelium fungivorum]|uniref:Glycosyltransferase n=1 Tax=Planoprotostelium fungivorum TaxID=1890364 RepID=A0A2P6MT05_9EUKA|nr:hypothetical protein PROFUN_09532 [Planoprotostelium fungivorum]
MDQHSTALNQIDINTVHFLPNESHFDEYIQSLNPTVEALTILDTQDIHSLRNGASIHQVKEFCPPVVSEIDGSANSEIIRELSSIHRSDHTWVVSDYEQKMLDEVYAIEREKVSVCSFFYSEAEMNNNQTSTEHGPIDEKLWPRIREKLNHQAELHVYGAYPDRGSLALTDKNLGVKVRGVIEDQYDMLQRYRINFAPLRFGAGIKGKISDGFFCGTPTITTRIGGEGMTLDGSDNDGQWGGIISRRASDSGLEDELVEGAVRLYTDQTLWEEKREHGYNVIREMFSEEKNERVMMDTINELVANKKRIREKNLTGALLW